MFKQIYTKIRWTLHEHAWKYGGLGFKRICVTCGCEQTFVQSKNLSLDRPPLTWVTACEGRLPKLFW